MSLFICKIWDIRGHLSNRKFCCVWSMTIYFLKWPRLNLCHMITHLFLRTETGTHPWHLFNLSIKINNQFQLYLWYIYINILYQQYQLNIIILLQCNTYWSNYKTISIEINLFIIRMLQCLSEIVVSWKTRDRVIYI